MTGCRRRAMAAVCCAVVLVLVPAGPASAEAGTTVAMWRMDEPAGARTATDSTGNGHDGAVGSDVRTGVRVDAATVFRFPAVDTRTVRRQHLVTVPHHPRLDPGTSDFSVSLRLRTEQPLANIAQKGQSGTAGGYWKIEVAGGQVACHFRSGTGDRLSVRSPLRIDDGRWHAVRCERIGGTVALMLDGERHERSGLSGSISNTWPVSIGGKTQCNQAQVGCDYFAGDLDFVRIRKD